MTARAIRRRLEADEWVACTTTRNESRSIRNLIRGLFEAGAAAVYVADADSTDGTPLLAEAAGAVVIQCGDRAPIRDGHIAGWRAALEDGAKWILTLDAGSSHSPREGSRMVRLLRASTDFDVVIGSRFVSLGCYIGGPFWRRLGSRFAAFVLSMIAGRKVYDWTSAFRAYRASALRPLIAADCRLPMHGYSAEVLLHAVGLGFRVHEFPISYRFTGSSFRWRSALRFAVRSVRLALTIRFRRPSTRINQQEESREMTVHKGGRP